MMESIVSVEWLAERLGRDDVVIADCRFELADPAAGRRAYEHDHIPAAVFFDLDKDLSRSPRRSGGRHPLPPMDEFTARLGAAGIDDTVMVICYDDSNGGMAARLWWMLRYAGHERVALLDGGYAAWLAAGKPVTRDRTAPVAREFVPRLQHHMVATMEEVREMSTTGRGIIIDSRAPERYRGEIEPLDPVAGHIPGAVNMPWEANVNEHGVFLEPDKLADRFGWVQGPAHRTERRDDVTDAIVVHCGSGVTGCVNVLALERAGVRGAKLYVGGWSDWCSQPDNPVAIGDESGDASKGQ